MGGCLWCLSGRSYFFLLLRRKEKSSKKEKAIFGQLLRWPKKGPTLDAHRFEQLYSAGFSCLSPATIEREFLFGLLVWYVATLQSCTAKKGTIKGWAASRLSAFFYLRDSTHWSQHTGVICTVPKQPHSGWVVVCDIPIGCSAFSLVASSVTNAHPWDPRCKQGSVRLKYFNTSNLRNAESKSQRMSKPNSIPTAEGCYRHWCEIAIWCRDNKFSCLKIRHIKTKLH
jgi:hypothetical protein